MTSLYSGLQFLVAVAVGLCEQKPQEAIGTVALPRCATEGAILLGTASMAVGWRGNGRENGAGCAANRAAPKGVPAVLLGRGRVHLIRPTLLLTATLTSEA